MGRIKNNDFYVIEKWMVKELKLSGRELQLYAIIYTAQCQKGEFCGSLNYIAEWLGTKSINTVLRAINKLLDMGLITKRQTTKDGVITNHYKVVLYTAWTAKERG